MENVLTAVAAALIPEISISGSPRSNLFLTQTAPSMTEQCCSSSEGEPFSFLSAFPAIHFPTVGGTWACHSRQANLVNARKNTMAIIAPCYYSGELQVNRPCLRAL
jgi:hypothetical protein